MKPLKSEATDAKTLEELGRASVQIVHDLKNQLNGLKLYATFLRKRMEKAERPEDERETINKLIQGLERAAADMTTLVRLGRPVELRRHPRVNLSRLLEEAANGEGAFITTENGAAPIEGELDAAAIGEALKAIHAGALSLVPRDCEDTRLEVHVALDESVSPVEASIEWRGIRTDTDPFHSYAGSERLRMTLAARVIEAHNGSARFEGNSLKVHLPLAESK